jgi:hypothetical protein
LFLGFDFPMTRFPDFPISTGLSPAFSVFAFPMTRDFPMTRFPDLRQTHFSPTGHERQKKNKALLFMGEGSLKRYGYCQRPRVLFWMQAFQGISRVS